VTWDGSKGAKFWRTKGGEEDELEFF